ncbi:hypothetical protein pb186bvf_013124 [Paramecium bursaria]
MGGDHHDQDHSAHHDDHHGDHNDHHEHHSHSAADEEQQHEILARQIHRLSPFYDGHRLPIIFRPFAQWFHKEVPSKIDTSNYIHKPINQYDQKTRLQRAQFALQKIFFYNPDFFPPAHQRILLPDNTGVFGHLFANTFFVMNFLYFTYLWRNRSFNARSIGFGVALYGFQRLILQAPNLLAEQRKQGDRHQLASLYVDILGQNLLHDVIDPNYPVYKMEQLQR